MDSHFVKLLGKAELPEPLEISQNYRFLMEGAIEGTGKEDNHDGTYNHYYKFLAIKVEAINALGKRIVAKDTRGRSKQLRSLLWKKWKESNENVEFAQYYDGKMLQIMQELY